MIAVTGAGGKTGRAVIRALHQKSIEVRAVVYRAEQAELSLRHGASDAVSGDLLDVDFLTKALENTDKVYHICPNVHPDERAIGQNVIKAAKANNVSLVAYHSVLHPQTKEMIHHWQKLQVEELLFEAGIDFIIVQPAPYMQNLVNYIDEILRQGTLTIPYSPDARISMVDLQDAAEAVSLLLSSDSFISGTYELVGTGAINHREVAEEFSRHFKIDVQLKQISFEDWQVKALRNGMGTYQSDALTAMFRYYDRHGLLGNNHVLNWLLGRSPIQLPAYINSIGDTITNL